MEKKAVLTETQMSHFQSEHGDSSKNDLLLFPIEIYALPEEGAKLVRAFVRIEQPELRKIIVELVSQLAKL
jgi:hypothetical protein